MDATESSAPFLVERIDEDIQLFRLNRPARLNALTKPMLTGLADLLTQMEAGNAGRALIIVGEGEKSFCAGTDLAEIQGLAPADRLAKNKLARQLMFRLSQSSVLSFAALNGLAYGGGLELAMGCMFRIALPHVRLALPEIKLGLIPAYAGTQFLPPLVGSDKAMEMMLTGEPILADEAVRIGLVSRLAKPDAPLLDQTLAFVRQMTRHSQPAIDSIRQCVAAAGASVTQAGLDIEDQHVRQVFYTDDANEGVQAFLEKRAPRFTHKPAQLPREALSAEPLASLPSDGSGFRAVIFDMDGLLIDSERPIRDVWINACHELGVAFEVEQYAQVIGRNYRDSDQILRELIDDDSLYEQVSAQVAESIKALAAGSGFALMPGALKLIRSLQAAGVALAVASSSRRSEVMQRLGDAGVLNDFSVFVAGDEVVNGKPAPDLFQAAAERLGVSAAQCLVFEDSEAGATGALAAGMGVVLVPDLQAPSTEIRMLSLDVLSSLTEVDDESLDEWLAKPG